jgi:O-antigen ligase
VITLRGLIESAREELPAPTLVRWAAIFFSLSILTFLISLAASQAFLALAGITYGIHVVRGRVVPHFPPVKLPLACFCLLSTLSIFWAENRGVGWFAVRKLVLFLILLLAVNLVTTTRHLSALMKALFLESALVGVVAIGQFVRQYSALRVLHPGEVYVYMSGDRIRGLMGHWMNFGGQQMLVFVCLVAFLLLAPCARRLWWLISFVVAVSIVLNFTRGVWVGAFAACVYLVARWRVRWLWAIPVLVIAGYLAAPDLVRKRLDSVRHPSADPSLAIRFEMWQVGWRMIQRHPFVGVGLGNIPETYTLYLPPRTQPEVGYRDHLHDDVLQIGAERGLPCLVAWIWLMVALSWHCWRIRRKVLDFRWIIDGAMAALMAMVVEGAFEYSFGASPVLMLFLFIVATPFIVERREDPSRNWERVVDRGLLY